MAEVHNRQSRKVSERGCDFSWFPKVSFASIQRCYAVKCAQNLVVKRIKTGKGPLSHNIVGVPYLYMLAHTVSGHSTSAETSSYCTASRSELLLVLPLVAFLTVTFSQLLRSFSTVHWKTHQRGTTVLRNHEWNAVNILFTDLFKFVLLSTDDRVASLCHWYRQYIQWGHSKHQTT